MSEDTSVHKILPHNTAAEMAVLGALLVDNEVATEVFEIVRPNDFYQPAHNIIFKTIQDLFENTQRIDTIILNDELQAQHQLDKIGGPAYLAQLIDTLPATANAVEYAKRVKEYALTRNLIKTATKIATIAYDGTNSVESLVDKSQKMILEVTDRLAAQEHTDMKILMNDILEMIDQYGERKPDETTGISTGFSKLNELSNGYQEGDLILVAARPSMGKTSVTLNMIHHLCIENETPAAFFSLEMPAKQIALNLLCCHARKDQHKLRSGMLRQSQIDQLVNAADALRNAPLYIVDNSNMSPLDISMRARRLHKAHGIKAIFIDYIQLIVPVDRRSDNRAQELAEVSRSLKGLAKDLKVPIIACAQLNRGIEQRKGKDSQPMLSDLRESGALEQDADLVLLLWRPKDEQDIEDNMPKSVERRRLEIAKNRNGPLGSVDLTFFKSELRFEEAQLRNYAEEIDQGNFEDEAAYDASYHDEQPF